MHSQLALTEHVSLNLAPLILLDPVCAHKFFLAMEAINVSQQIEEAFKDII